MAEKTALVLMKRDSDLMNVPEGKLAAYLDDGWTEVSRTYMNAPVATETDVPPVDDKPKSKGK
jgi:hypothetical protein